jgi:hypothetical protein
MVTTSDRQSLSTRKIRNRVSGTHPGGRIWLMRVSIIPESPSWKRGSRGRGRDNWGNTGRTTSLPCKEGGPRSPLTGLPSSKFFFSSSQQRMNCVRVFYALSSSCQEACVSCKFRSPSSSASAGVNFFFFFFTFSKHSQACRTYLVHFTLHQYGTA